jgi:hypothetical protein
MLVETMEGKMVLNNLNAEIYCRSLGQSMSTDRDPGDRSWLTVGTIVL